MSSLMKKKKKTPDSAPSSGQGFVSCPNGQQFLLEYKENFTVKDLVEEVCCNLDLLPVTWPFFGICPSDREHYLYPYGVLTRDDCSRQLRFRVMVNVGPNCFHFKYLDDKAFNLYFEQVRKDYLLGHLDAMVTEYMLWMGGIDMARKAQEEKMDFKGILQRYTYQDFLPPSCMKKMRKTRRVVVAAFDKFYSAESPFSDGKLKLKYLEIAEKSALLECHRYQAEKESDQGRVSITLLLSVKNGIEMKIHSSSDFDGYESQMVCHLHDIEFIECSSRTTSSSQSGTDWIARIKSDARENHFLFSTRQEMVSFCVMADTLYLLKVNCNKCILEGTLKPPERYLKITEKDPVNSMICHGLISRDAVQSLLGDEGLEDGLYLVRKSRQRTNSYTLHVCLQRRIRNFEITVKKDGKLYILPNAEFESLLKLVYHYHKEKHGLPVPLLRILPPNKTRAVPLLDKDPKNLKGRGPSSPDIGDPLIPPVEPSTSGDSSCSSDISANDNNLNGINDNNVDQEFSLHQHELLNGHIEPSPSLLPQQPVDNRLQWMSSTTLQISKLPHPNPVHPSLPSPNVLSLQQPLNPVLTSSIVQSSLGSPPAGFLASSMQNGTANHHPGLLTNHAPAGLLGGHHTVGLPTVNHKIRGTKQSRLTAPLPPSNDIPFSQIKRGRKLGQGHFSDVYKGEMVVGQTIQQVAIKVLKKKSITEGGGIAENEFFKEASNMSALHHPHIVKFLGRSHNPEEELMLITEFVPLGDLRNYLRGFKNRRQEVPMDRLVMFSCQIAEGMEYLEEKNIVHRDLAARNVLVQDDSCVKISDFGLARQLNLQENSTYYRVADTRSVSLPLWWYAPESICEWKFTHANDVWSFGVTLWEIFSYGDTPKFDIKVLDRMGIYQHLMRGKRLKQPRTCPDEIYRIIVEHCWHERPESRMNFHNLSRTLTFTNPSTL